MGFLYDSLDFLPEVMQRPAVALLIIILGYYFSKIFSAVLDAIIPEKQAPEPIEADDVLPLRPRFIRSSFWVSWLICIMIGYSQLPLLASAMNNWSIQVENGTNLIMILIGLILFMTFETSIEKLSAVVSNFFNSLPLPKLNVAAPFIMRLIWIPIFAISGLALDNPQTTGLKLTATILLLVLGLFLAGVVKTTVASVMGLERAGTHRDIKIFFYGVCATFCVTAIRVWV